MADWFTDGSVLDIILALVVAEALVLVWWCCRRGRSPTVILPNLAAGFALMLAVRFALADQDWRLVAGALAAALLAHLIDLRFRLAGTGRRRSGAGGWSAR